MSATDTSECIFCRIAAKSVPAEIVAEDDHLMAFSDIHPRAPVHILVIPKEHIQSIIHLENNHSDVLAGLIYAAKRIAGDRNLRGYKLLFNVGREGGQEVDHLHLHLLGGWQDGEIGSKKIIPL